MINLFVKQAIKINKSSYFTRLRISLILIVMMLLTVALNATEYAVDKVTSKVNWEAKKVTGKHDGTISFNSGLLTVTNNQISGGTFVMDMKSIANTDITDAGMKAKLMGHLASDDFFAITKFPESKMIIKQVTPVSAGEFHFLADLTIKGITNPIEFNAKVSVNNDKLIADGVITVNRTLYGIRYGSGKFFEGLGDKMIYDDFTLTFNVVAQKK